ncbi:MAG: hypothetical protein GY911_07365, partial [Actinomycetales bacterium]|nr:hypothetical protein [Actinomycetales bacterium]
MRPSLIALVAVFSFAAVPSAHATSVPDARVGDSRQVIVVEAPRWSSTEGTLTAFEKRRGEWTITQPTVRAQLGYGGLVRGDRRRQGTGTVPTGSFDILRGFGRKADPGTSMKYVQVDRNDAWTYNPRVPSTYNVFQTVDRSWNSYGGYV